MIRFECDYAEGAHPKIIQRLASTNMEQTPGYGEDPHCENARAIIRALCSAPDAEVQFLVGGTQTNMTVIAAALRPHQGVIAASTGHINVHETGAIEATGHKVLPIPSSDGKLYAEDIARLVDAHWADATHEHMVQPAMVYISFPTENGTLYSKAELTSIRDVCLKRNLLLFVDGARMGYGLMSPANDLTLADFARLCDVFYIGGTKVGMLFGEAVVITHPALKRDFRYMIKQRGGMFAKGRLLGLQFEALLEDNTYFTIAKAAVDKALLIRQAFESKGFPLLYDSYTNQQYPILPNTIVEALSHDFALSHWADVDAEHTAVRVCTSWATTDEAVDTLIHALLFFGKEK